MRIFSRRLAALTVLATLTLSGCGGSSDSDDSPSTSDKTSASSSTGFDVDPADGETIKGSDYSYVVPKGWKTPSTKPSGFDFDSLAVDSGDKDGFADNINVIVQDPAPSGVTSSAIESQLADQLKTQGAKDVVQKKQVTVAGEKATHIASSQDLNGKKNATEQYYVVRSDKFYVITFSYSTSLSESDRDQVSESVLTTWKWS